ncbi:MAG: 30S ribosomal protein S9 [Sulfolobales archaeon]|nr:30S ribosomal protein S9 [Sulfolobales archaeon]MCX8186805.1 30S ribosomal protein S9 [Sulfolobales archaeon]MDW7969862.1 30S ribosomal protein S9 [Sulfolobales archaeon]
MSGRQLKIVISSSKRKTAVARVTLKPGKGRVWVNGIPLEILPIEMARLKIMEPLLLAGEGIWNSVDIKVSVSGGGYMSQAEAARTAIARALLLFTGSDELKQRFKEYGRAMLAGDSRQTEPEKWMRYSARRWRQKSYR